MKKMRKIICSVINTGYGTRNEYDIVCSGCKSNNYYCKNFDTANKVKYMQITPESMKPKLLVGHLLDGAGACFIKAVRTYRFR